MNNLENLKNSDVDGFTLDGQEFDAKVVDVYDGDTCRIIFNLNDRVVKYTCRLSGLDCPEMRPSLSIPTRDVIIKNAKRSRNRLISLATNCEIDIDSAHSKKATRLILDKNKKIIRIKCGVFDKYGRLLVSMSDIDNTDRNQYINCMINEGFGHAYGGGSKR